MSRDISGNELLAMLDNPDKVLIKAYEVKLDSISEELRCIKELLNLGSASSAQKRIEVLLATIHSLGPITQANESAQTASNS